MRSVPPPLTYLSIILFFALIVLFQIKSDSYLPPFTTRYDATHRDLLPVALLPYVTFGFDRVLADYYWVQSIQDYASWDQEDPYYIGYLRNIIVLDPTFKYPYLFNIVAVPKNLDQLSLVVPYAEYGMKYIPSSWEIPYYIGTEYYLFTKKTDPAVSYIKKATEVRDAPPGVYLNYSSLITKSSNTFAQTSNLFKTIYDTTSDETLKKIVSLGIAENTIDDMLTKGITAYKTLHNHYPESLKDLEEEHLVSIPEELTDLFTITINSHTGVFKLEQK